MKKSRIVTYDIAKLLSEKGFKEQVCNVIYPDGSIENSPLKDYNSIDKSNDVIKYYSAPTLNEVADWLMDKYNIFIEIDYLFISYNYSEKYKYIVIDTTNEDFGGDVLFRAESSFATKEMALKEAIRKVLNKFKTTIEESVDMETAIANNFFKELCEKNI
jgi:hypothetical protein